MVGHTGFLCTSRRLADGVEPPLRRRRPSKGMYGEPAVESPPSDEPFRPNLP
jgi:tRNA (adenine57-N1/adenine58-N1)-methyltransferase